MYTAGKPSFVAVVRSSYPSGPTDPATSDDAQTRVKFTSGVHETKPTGINWLLRRFRAKTRTEYISVETSSSLTELDSAAHRVEQWAFCCVWQQQCVLDHVEVEVKRHLFSKCQRRRGRTLYAAMACFLQQMIFLPKLDALHVLDSIFK